MPLDRQDTGVHDHANCVECMNADADDELARRLGEWDIDPLDPSYDDEPKGTCVIHGDYWTDSCRGCGW